MKDLGGPPYEKSSKKKLSSRPTIKNRHHVKYGGFEVQDRYLCQRKTIGKKSRASQEIPRSVFKGALLVEEKFLLLATGGKRLKS